MKIAFYSPAWPVSHAQNGIVTYVDIMVRAMREAGHECVVVTPRLLAVRPEDAGTVFALPDGAQRSGLERMWLRARAKLDRETWLRQLGRDITQALDDASRNGPVDVLDIEESFGMARFIKGAPAFVRLHGPHFVGHFGEKTANDERRIISEGRALEAARAVTSPSPGLLEATREFYGGLSRPAAVIPNPVAPAPQDDVWRYEECDPNLILYVGRFDLRKGADVMLEAFSKVARRRKSLRLIMAGRDDGVEVGSSERLHYPEYAKRYLDEGVASRIEFLGQVSPEELRELRRRAFVFVSASRFECHSYAVMEALMHGCPAIVSSTLGPPEFLKDNQELLVFEIENAEHLAMQIDALCEKPALAKDLGAAGRRAVQDIFAPAKVAQDMAAFYAQVGIGVPLASNEK